MDPINTEYNKPPLRDSLEISIKIWAKDSELLADFATLAAKYGVEYSLNDYFGDKSTLLSFDETYDLLDLTDVKAKYIKQIHQANILANILVLVFDEIQEKQGINILDSIGFFNNEIIIEA
jgi:hypothetical protein